MAFGAGYFGWKTFRYERVTLYVVNATDEPLSISIGSVSATIDAHEQGRLDFRAGDRLLESHGPGGELIESVAFFTDNQSVFYNLDGARCYGVVNASNVYGGQGSMAEPFEVVDTIARDDRIYHIPNGRFVRPGSILPQTVQGGSRVIWIERGACELLTPENYELWLAQLMVRHDARRERREEEERRRREMMQ